VEGQLISTVYTHRPFLLPSFRKFLILSAAVPGAIESIAFHICSDIGSEGNCIWLDIVRLVIKCTLLSTVQVQYKTIHVRAYSTRQYMYVCTVQDNTCMCVQYKTIHVHAYSGKFESKAILWAKLLINIV
jgi:hypothetical protein